MTWWCGPEFLKKAIAEQPIKKYETECETKKICLHTMKEEPFEFPNVSNFWKLQRVFVYINRAIKKMKKEERQMTNELTVKELQEATYKIIKIVQKQQFEMEIKTIKENNELPKTNAIKSLSIFLDDEGMLRVGGRLKNAEITYNMKHQILLPKNNKVTDLIIKSEHLKAFHSGPRLTEALIRKKFWIVNGMSTIKKTLRNCIICKKCKPKPLCQKMGELPKCRVKLPQKPFINCAIDYAGPIKIKESKLRNSKILKAYISLFVCMATKAVHLEVVSDLTAEAFIGALRRFTSRRGQVNHIYSDNGTNFTKANKLLSELTEKEKEEFECKLNEETEKNEIQFHFSPAYSPHFNGIAESAVRSAKYHLKRTIKTAFTFEELTTILSQIEAVMNSRPLCIQSTDPNEATALTPAHFLNLIPTVMPPDENLSDIKNGYLSRWQLVQKIQQNLAKRWKEEYLNQLQQRKKWFTKDIEAEIDDIVMLKDENKVATTWRLGKVLEKYPGKDGLTRVMKIKTSEGERIIEIGKIAPLPIERNEQQVITTHFATTKSEKNEKNKHKSYWKWSPVLALTILCMLTPTRVMGETNRNDVAKAIIDGVVTVFNSDTTKEIINSFKNRHGPMYDGKTFNLNDKRFVYLKGAEFERSQITMWCTAIGLTSVGVLLFILLLCCIWCRGTQNKVTKPSTRKEVIPMPSLEEI